MPKRPAFRSASSAKKKSTTVSYFRLRSAPSSLVRSCSAKRSGIASRMTAMSISLSGVN